MRKYLTICFGIALALSPLYAGAVNTYVQLLRSGTNQSISPTTDSFTAGKMTMTSSGSASSLTSTLTSISIQAGHNGTGSGAGFPTNITGGNAANSTDTNGGNVVLTGGTGDGAGHDGYVLASPRLGIATTAPSQALSVAGEAMADNFVSTSPTGTSSFSNDTAKFTGRYFPFGGAPNNEGCIVSPDPCLELWGTTAGSNGVQMGVGNTSAADTAFAGFFWDNDLAVSNDTTHYAFAALNSSTYSDHTYGDLLAVPSQWSIQNTDGPITFVVASTSPQAYINGGFSDGIAGTSLEVFRATKDKRFGVATTAPWGILSVGVDTPSTAPYAFNVGTNSTTYFGIQNISSNRFRIGVGTSSPVYDFDMAKTSTSVGSEITNHTRNYNSQGYARVMAEGNGGNQIALHAFGNSFPISSLSNKTLVGSNQDLLLTGNIDVSSGGSNSVSILTGGYDASTQTRMTVASGGNVGIGSTTPGTLFSVGSSTSYVNINPNATSTFSKGINIQSGCFAVSGTCVGSGSGSGTVSSGLYPQLAWYSSNGTTLTGSSTESLTMGRYIATSTTATSTFAGGFTAGNNAGFTVNKAAPARSLYVTSSGRIGAGTSATSPIAQLDVLSPTSAIPAIRASGPTNGGDYSFLVSSNGGNQANFRVAKQYDGSGYGFLVSGEDTVGTLQFYCGDVSCSGANYNRMQFLANPIDFLIAPTDFSSRFSALYIDTTGYVGILNTAPTGQLHVKSSGLADTTSYGFSFNYGPSGYTADGSCHDFTLYAYKQISSINYYSPNGSEFSDCDDNSFNPYTIEHSWTAVTAADGYVLVRNDDGTQYDVGNTTSFSDDNSVWSAPADVGFKYIVPTVIAQSDTNSSFDMYTGDVVGVDVLKVSYDSAHLNDSGNGPVNITTEQATRDLNLQTNGGRVSIGGAYTPRRTLDVNGGATTDNGITIRGDSGKSQALVFQSGSTYNNNIGYLAAVQTATEFGSETLANDMNFGVVNNGRFLINFAPNPGTNSTTRFLMRQTGVTGIGTTSPNAMLTIATTTGAQLNLVDGSLSSPGISFRNKNGNFWLATSSASGATSTVPFITALTASGNVGISTTSPFRTLSVGGTFAVSALSAFAAGDSAVCQRAGGEITVDTGVASCIVSSRTVKHDIKNLSLGEAEERIAKLNPVSFTYNGINKNDLGLVAEDVADIDPRYAQYNEKGEPRAINWSAITADLIKVIQAKTDTATRTAEENWQWIVIGLLVVWNVALTLRKNGN